MKRASLRAFEAEISSYQKQIDEALFAVLDLHQDSLFYKPFKHALKAGKRIRPIVLLLSYEAVKRRSADPFPAAIAVELAHMESLIHDDIIDQDSVRRAKKAFHVLYGYETTLLSADFVLSMILDLTARYSKPRVSHELSEATSMMAEGELEGFIVCKKREPVTIEEYVKIISKKTASLFKASAAIGAAIGEASENQIKALSQYGNSLGVAYQIQDDISDSKKDKETSIVSFLRSDPDVEFSLQSMCDSFVVDAKQRLEALKASEAKATLLRLADSVGSKLIGVF